MARSYLKVYFDFDEKTEELNDGEKGRLLLAMYRYAKTAEKPSLTGNERFLFAAFKGGIDKDIATYNAKVANGSLGGRPAMDEQNPTKPNETEENLNKPNETENNLNAKNKNKNKEEEKEIKENHLKVVKEKLRFSPPALEEVKAYCQERGNRVDAERFVNFYASKGWKVGNQPMKDWKAAVRTWEKGGTATSKTVPAQQYQQRNYTEEELLSVSDDLMEEARRARA